MFTFTKSSGYRGSGMSDKNKHCEPSSRFGVFGRRYFGYLGLHYSRGIICRKSGEMKPSRTSETRSPRLLPPLLVAEGSGSGSRSPTLRSPNALQTSPKLWSYYHRGCFDTSPESAGDKKRSSHLKPCRYKIRNLSFAPSKDESSIVEYLDHHRDFLEEYVMGHVTLDQIERWMLKKLARSPKTERYSKNHEAKSKVSPDSIAKQSFLELVQSLVSQPSEHSLVWELAQCAASSARADTVRVFKLFPDHPDYVQHFVLDPQNPHGAPELARVEPAQVALVLEAATRAAPWRLSRGDTKFPRHEALLAASPAQKNEADHVMYQPVFTVAGKPVYVIELWKVDEPFKVSDEETSSRLAVWGCLALHYCSLYLDKKRERNMSDFLLDVVKAIFEEMVSLDQLIKRILEFAQRLVNADRASLFLVDYRNFELVSTVFDLKFEPGQSRDVERKEVRMPINRGIAGHVALSGETMNIPDAYSDYRFNREVDEATGYKTINILCMPIKVQGKVIGVVQMVNKRSDDSFQHDDEAAFEIFSTFFGLALHHARLYDRIKRKEQKYKVALEVLSYHNTCRENEVQAILSDKETLTDNLNNFYLDPYKFNEFEKCKAVIAMFNDLFDISKFDVMTVTRFMLTVKKNYRTVPYHNFDHGWSVAHSMYVIVKNDMRRRYSYNVRLALFVACLCHDLDHRGYTNKYMSETASPLAAMYTTSTLEHHHFNITVTILQQDGHNIFSHMSGDEFKDILGLIRQCILATDLAAFFPNLARIKDLHQPGNKFSWALNNHRELAMAISMTAADLSASAKPWDIQIKTVKVIFEEFYDQGDKERAAGRTPISMMDRGKPDEQPASQVGFLSQICIPCYDMLYRILPKTKPMYAMAMDNLRKWKAKADFIQRQKETGIDVHYDLNDVDNIPTEVLPEEEIGEIEEGEEDSISEEEPCDAEVKIVRETANASRESIQEGDVAWDDEEQSFESEKKVGGKLQKDIEGVTWIDEEGVVVRQNAGLKKGNSVTLNEDL